jgi:hypothetical protein
MHQPQRQRILSFAYMYLNISALRILPIKGILILNPKVSTLTTTYAKTKMLWSVDQQLGRD